MKIKILSLILCLFLSPGLVLAQVTVMRGYEQKKGDKRTALVIGNSNYKTSPLDNPVNDAQDIATILQKQKFHITLLTNGTQKEMETEIHKFGKRLQKDSGVGLFYYAGHGMQINGHNYLIPVDANVESASDVKYEAIDAGRILGKMEDADNDLNIVILDACRNNPYSRSFRSASQGLAQMDAPAGSIIAYATAPGSVAADGKGRNGVYTQNLILYMQEPGLSIEQVFKKVRKNVVVQTDSKQVPWESSSLTGNFFFVDGDIKIVQAPALTGTDPAKKADQAMWFLVENSTNPQDVERYLQEFPEGTYSRVATLKLEQIKRQQDVITSETQAVASRTPTTKPSQKADQAMWLLVAKSTKATDVERYLQEFPQGIYSQVASLKLEQLQRPAEGTASEPTKPKRNIDDPYLEKLLVMMESPDYRQKAKGAKYIWKKKYGKNTTALDAMSDMLIVETANPSLSKGNAKILIYICKVIALSENAAYVEVLDKIATDSPNRAIKKYATKYAVYLDKKTGGASKK